MSKRVACLGLCLSAWGACLGLLREETKHCDAREHARRSIERKRNSSRGASPKRLQRPVGLLLGCGLKNWCPAGRRRQVSYKHWGSQEYLPLKLFCVFPHAWPGFCRFGAKLQGLSPKLKHTPQSVDFLRTSPQDEDIASSCVCTQICTFLLPRRATTPEARNPEPNTRNSKH